MHELLPMSLKQLDKLDVLRRVERGEITQISAAALLGCTDRTIRRKVERLEDEGPSSLAHGLKGRRSNNRMPEKEEKKIAQRLQAKYPDFGPTFASEKLEELHGIFRDPRTVRRIQVGLGLWRPKSVVTPAVHRFFRVRRCSCGELIQFDGSYHDWFEGRGGISEACLLLSVDDATGAIMHAVFAPHEGVLPVMEFWLEYAGIHGIPQAIYLDRFSTYSMNMKTAAENPDTLTQFERAARDVGTQIIHAMSPQAKGRVENKFGTLQDRLVKEMRLRGIATVAEANAFLRKSFIPAYNRRFGKVPTKPGDLHRKPSERELSEILPFIFCRKESRVIQHDFTIPYKKVRLQILPTPRLAIRPTERVDVHEKPDGSLHLFLRAKPVSYHMITNRAPEASNPSPQTLTA